MQKSDFKNNYWKFERLHTPTVYVGNIKLGSKHPVRVQSMANTSTHDVDASVKQAIEIINAGGELVRFTVINRKDADALKSIKEKLLTLGYETPIVADVHFNPDLADITAQYVDKVRINPGNYLDKRATFNTVTFTDTEYQAELSRLKTRFLTFLDICKKHNTAVRIGTNHGSLSDRIMSRFGDTPAGMVEATMEFLRICHDSNFKHVVVSLKSSNTRVMIHAYRLLALQMQQENISFALHLGVTEAGSGADGRIKSAVGIGALMQDGLGDTIRVSLTEHPAYEIPVAQKLVSHFERLANSKLSVSENPIFDFYNYNPANIDARFYTYFKQPLVISDLSGENEITQNTIANLGLSVDQNGHLLRSDQAPDMIFTGELFFPYQTNKTLQSIIDCKYWDERSNAFPLFSLEEYKVANKKSRQQNWVQIHYLQLDEETIQFLKKDETLVLVCFSYHQNYVQELKALINKLHHQKIYQPIVIQQNYTEIDAEDFRLKAAADLGTFFVDGLAHGLWLKNTFSTSNEDVCRLSFDILQASRARTTKTEYISCPSCGRTLFDLETTVEKVKQATAHLKGLKIAVMGCIVNGPGEMADADYGYVGASPGKVSLYKKKTLIKRNIDANLAVEELLALIERDL